MKKFLYLLVVVLFVNSNLFAQNPFNDKPAPEQSEDIWSKKQTNSSAPQASKIRPRDPSPIPVSTPIDGGVVVLLAAGALYGKKRINQNRKGIQK